MTRERCSIEVFWAGTWREAAVVWSDDVAKGIRSSAILDYATDYLEALEFSPRTDARAVSCRYPTTFESYVDGAWPAFLLDVIPSGAARRFWERRLNLPNTESSDWKILLGGGGNAPGNVRIREAAMALPPPDLAHPGFERREVLDRKDTFIEYAYSRGAPVAGASGAAGDAPKFLLCEDGHGRWHADEVTKRSHRWWLVKFPRGSSEADRVVLEAEAGFMRVAKRLRARVAALPTWEQDCFFVERFDRHRIGPDDVERFGLESLCSLAGVSEFGPSISKLRLANAITKFTNDPAAELREFLLRDVLDVALGNTDNHARNTAVLKDAGGGVALSPLYDFAPMVLDPQGIARVCRWDDEEDGYPIWGKVVDSLRRLPVDVAGTKAWLRELAPEIRSLMTTMRDERVPERVIETLDRRVERTARMLAETK